MPVLTTVSFHYHPQLIPLLSAGKRQATVELQLPDHPAVKDSIEACGIPHTEVDVILANGRSVGFDYRLQDGDRIEVFPYGFSPSTRELVHLCLSPTVPLKFALDVHLGKLARRLRMLGLDCFYSNHCDDPELINLALSEQRVLLTRDRGVLKHGRIRDGLLIRSGSVAEQVREVLFRYRRDLQVCPLSRCTSCNGTVQPVGKDRVRHLLLPKTARYYEQFFQCLDCGQLYWKGSHYQRIIRWLDELLAELRE